MILIYLQAFEAKKASHFLAIAGELQLKYVYVKVFAPKTINKIEISI